MLYKSEYVNIFIFKVNFKSLTHYSPNENKVSDKIERVLENTINEIKSKLDKLKKVNRRMSCKKCFKKFNSLSQLHDHSRKHKIKSSQSLKELKSTSKLSVQKRIYADEKSESISPKIKKKEEEEVWRW